MQVFNFTLSTKNVFSKNVTIPSMVHASAFYKGATFKFGVTFFLTPATFNKHARA